jgi:BirA family biotin operon repressor/biotin-[acetyl-CoA-carboxylase] ligase
MNPAVGGARRIAFAVVESTNDEAMNRAISGADMPFWVTAERQTVGRGRQGAHWASEKGNLYASAAFGVRTGWRLSDLPIIACVALYDALCDLLPNGFANRLAIKWPNDILFAGRKVSGILAESQKSGTDRLIAIVGFGVNLKSHPEDTRYPATDFAAEGVDLEPESVFRNLAASMGDRMHRWHDDPHGYFRQTRTDWLARATGIGRPVDVRLPGETLSGKFLDMDDQGRLMLQLDDGEIRRISTGEVFFTQQNEVTGADGQ